MAIDPVSHPAPDTRRGILALPYAVYGVCAWLLFLVLSTCTLLIALPCPRIGQRRWVARAGARASLLLTGMRLRVESIGRIPAGQCVIVSNHASYLDGPVYTAVLPPRFGFVIKREMAAVPLAGLMLRIIGSQFVERHDRERRSADARRLFRDAANGQSLVFFPEGTFASQPGLLKFHTGAFVTAARARCPVVPAVIRGTRSVLPPGHALPRPATIKVEFLPPLYAAATNPDAAATELRERARAAILQRLGEPDLA